MSTSEKSKDDVGNCPVCTNPLTHYPPIAIACDNPECPVEDDPDLWYIASDGTWKAQRWVQGVKTEHGYMLSLTPKE